MIHYLYIGHFQRDGAFVRFVKQDEAVPAWYRPTVEKPLDPEIVNELLTEQGLEDFPSSWGMRKDESGFIAWDRFCGVSAATNWIVRLAIRTACDLADYSSLTLLSPAQFQTAMRAGSESPRDRNKDDASRF